MKGILIILILLLLNYNSYSQKENWDVYLAQYDDGPGSIVLNMDLINNAPKGNLPFIIITGVTFDDCGKDGFPSKNEFKNLYKIEEEIKNTISKITDSEYAGIFTYQCERLNYYYLKDSTNIRTSLTKMYNDEFENYKFFINIRLDKDWEAYTKFLYPSEQIQEYMSNQKVLDQLQAAGDNLTKKRLVDHWIYFATKESRKIFINYAKEMGFKIQNSDRIDNPKLPYQLQISRIDFIDIESISNLTIKLRNKAKELDGDYDGWETFVIKDE